jgi:hypothetical protein
MMMTTAIVGVVALAAATYMSQQQRTVKDVESHLRIVDIANKIQQTITNPTILRNSADLGSAPGNIQLRNCLATTASALANGTSCTATDPQHQVTFDLILPIRPPTIVNIASIESNTKAGENSKPALYKILDGTQCPRSATSDPQCNLRVKAYFWATCPADLTFLGPTQTETPGRRGRPSLVTNSTSTPTFAPTVCSRAQTINVRYQVTFSQNATTGAGTTLHNIPNVPDDKLFWTDPSRNTTTTFGAVTLPVSLFPGPSVSPIACPTNSSLIGVVDGVPKCACMFPFKPAPGCVAGQTCACIDIDRHCAPDERYRGIDLNGNIICCPVYCQTVVVTSSSSTPKGCRTGGWIESIKEIWPTTSVSRTVMQNGVPVTTNITTAYKGSCMSDSECSLGKWGGSCSTNVICKESYNCCYEYGGTTGALCNSGH